MRRSDTCIASASKRSWEVFELSTHEHARKMVRLATAEHLGRGTDVKLQLTLPACTIYLIVHCMKVRATRYTSLCLARIEIEARQ